MTSDPINEPVMRLSFIPYQYVEASRRLGPLEPCCHTIFNFRYFTRLSKGTITILNEGFLSIVRSLTAWRDSALWERSVAIGSRATTAIVIRHAMHA